MIHYIKGTYAARFESGVVVETGGIGYEVTVPDNSAVYLASEGDDVMLYTAMIVREDDVSLYGFSDKEGLALFRQLISVSGIGAKAAMAILSIAPTLDVRKAIAFEDADFITRANGVGKKTAQRVVLELKDKVGTPVGSSSELVSQIQSAEKNDARSEAVAALISLGYSRMDATNTVAAVSGEGLTSEEYIKQALRILF